MSTSVFVTAKLFAPQTLHVGKLPPERPIGGCVVSGTTMAVGTGVGAGVMARHPQPESVAR